MSSGWKLSEETKRRIGENNVGMSGKHHTRKSCRKISRSLTGKHLSEKTKKKIGESNSGPNNGNWRGGISFSRYCHRFNHCLRERVRIFFGRKCLWCNKEESKNFTSTGKHRRLSVHHITFDKMVCCNKEEPLLAPLCIKCCSMADSDRDGTKMNEELRRIIIEEYGGRCFISKEEYKNL